MRRAAAARARRRCAATLTPATLSTRAALRRDGHARAERPVERRLAGAWCTPYSRSVPRDHAGDVAARRDRRGWRRRRRRQRVGDHQPRVGQRRERRVEPRRASRSTPRIPARARRRRRRTAGRAARTGRGAARTAAPSRPARGRRRRREHRRQFAGPRTAGGRLGGGSSRHGSGTHGGGGAVGFGSIGRMWMSGTASRPISETLSTARSPRRFRRPRSGRRRVERLADEVVDA